MNTASVKTHCGRFPGATTTLHDPPVNVLSYRVGGHTFAYFKTSEPERWRFSVRVNAERFLELTSVPGIKPARYMARFHWVTIVDVRAVPPAYLRELIAWSYDKALTRLSKRLRAEIAAGGRAEAPRRARSEASRDA